MSEKFKQNVEKSITRTVDRFVSGHFIVLRFYEGKQYMGVYQMPEYMDIEASEVEAYWVDLGKLPFNKHAA